MATAPADATRTYTLTVTVPTGTDETTVKDTLIEGINSFVGLAMRERLPCEVTITDPDNTMVCEWDTRQMVQDAPPPPPSRRRL